MAKGETDDGVAKPTSYDFPCWGMTLRDYFAGQALVAMLSNPERLPPGGVLDLAGATYQMADAMLEARKR